MWRHDAGRTAVSAEELPAEFHLQWVRELPPVKPAFRSRRLQFDRGYEPVVMGKTLFVALPNHDYVVAFDTDTGAEGWRFYTDGPVRFAPVAWQDKVFFGSDDGCVYCLKAGDGTLDWKFQAVPSNRKVLGNGRLISVWPVRGGPVIADGTLYFAAGVWPFEGIFVYALDAETGRVVWMNDRTGYLYGMHPHGAQAMGGVTPQGYLIVNGDDLVVPCGTTTAPAVFDRHTGELKSFALPGEGRVPGGWFMALDTDGARDVRRGKVVSDSAVNRERHEDAWHQGPGTPDVCSRISVDGRAFAFSEGIEGVEGKVHSMVAADGKLFVVTVEANIYCFGAESGGATRHGLEVRPTDSPPDAWRERAAGILQATGVKRGYALLWGVGEGRLVEELAVQSELHIVAVETESAIVGELRRSLDERGLYGSRAVVHAGTPLKFGLPPYMASLVVVVRLGATAGGSDAESIEALSKSLRPYGGVACIPIALEERLKQARLTNARVERLGDFLLLRRMGALPGAVNYEGDWTSPDERVRAPLGLLWYDDSLMRNKRAPQPLILNGVMISQDKDWLAEPMRMGSAVRVHEPGTGRFYLKSPEFMDVYTGRRLAKEEAVGYVDDFPDLPGTEERPPYHYRPPYVDAYLAAHEKNGIEQGKWPFLVEVDKGEMVNPMTGEAEPRRFVKSYGCDGGNDYGYLFGMRSGTAAFYDKRIESGTINISGPRSGCTNTVIPANGVLNLPYFYDGCSCSYPLPVGAALVSMPPEYEQWTGWGTGPVGPIQRVGINFGAPGDRMTDAGTLWVDYPSVGGPSPEVNVKVQPETSDCFYRHSVWIEGGTGWPWVAASGVTGISTVTLAGLKEGSFTVRLFFVEPEFAEPGQRIFDVALQGESVLDAFDIAKESGGRMRCIYREFKDVAVSGTLEVQFTPHAGMPLVSGVEAVQSALPLDALPVLD